MSFLHLRASTSKQRLIKKKGCARMFVGRPLLSGLHVPFRIEAVIKILTFRVLFSLMF